ncbi:MAG: long-chain acyl-CoA synthetase, partial [Thermoleophilaceae bacterium]|nr:long-chain acyl-CoA synthetase [Thermoleophilaceae bacterium]
HVPAADAPAALDVATLCEAFQRTAAARADSVAIRTIGDGVSITWAEYAQRVERIAAGLAALGLRRGDSFACMLVNRPEFHLVDVAAMHLGATAFSIYNTSSPEQVAYLFGDAGNRIVVTEQQYLDVIRASGAELEHVVVVDGEGGTLTLADLEAGGDPDFDFEAAWHAVEPGDVLTLIYTSGTTGPPKGVELTHANVLAMIGPLRGLVPDTEGASVISFLPHAHIADRGVLHYSSLYQGYTVTDCPDPKQIVAHLIDTRPELFGAVPRIFEKLKAALEAGVAAEQDEGKRAATEAALAAGRERIRLEQAGEPVPAEVTAACERAEQDLFVHIRAMLGLDKVRATMVGAAPCPLEVEEFFAAIGLPLSEVWGMSETSAIATINPPGAQRYGTVGPPIDGVEIRLDDDGEILVRGAIIMRGYRNQPDKTRETISEDGWLRTGDIGAFDDHGYLKIVDRKKELIINAAGKNMSPANIETTLKSANPLIGQAVCVGDGRPYNVALIVLDPDVAPAVAAKLGIEDASLGSLASDERVRAVVAEAVDQANAKLSRVEQIKKFALLPDEWLPGGEELTPTMKLKRKPIASKYESAIEALYAG